ncbi:MAG TPA: type IX secretion system sortase PorU [Cytophagaceae bacterium]|nr:type IX secretion system sortase PorU [Cytophagaceae bacterium]
MAKQKRIIFLLLFTFLFAAFANAQTIQVKWTKPVMIMDTTFKPVKALYFDGAKIEKDLLPYYCLTLYNVSAGNFRLINTKYQLLNDTETAIIQNKIIPTNASIKIGIQNKRPVSTVLFVPLRMNGQGLYEKLVSFSYEYDVVPFSDALPGAKIKHGTQTASYANAKVSAASGVSVLATGTWYQIAVSGNGMYKIDYNTLKSIGINPDQIDPRYLKIYGNGGGMLPQANSSARPDDLLENAIYIVGEGDGNFDQGDYILFFAKGPDSWEYNSSETIFNHEKNIYSDKAYYFVTLGSTPGARIQNQADLGSAAQVVNYFDEHLFYESDNTNILGSGRDWYGDTFGENISSTFNFNTAGMLPASTLYITSAVMSSSVSSTSFSMKVNGVSASSSQFLIANNLSTYDYKGREDRAIFSFNSSTIGTPSNLAIVLSYDRGSSASSIGYLDYLEVNMKRSLALYGNESTFRTIASTGAATTQYQVSNAAGALIWDVTDITNIKNITYTTSGSTAIFSANSTTLEEYIVFSGGDFPTPEVIGAIPNQNLHGINAPYLPDMVIVTHPEFLAQAHQLANFRKSFDNLDVTVVTTQQVYNEFSSGAQDVTAIRDFMKMLYDRKSGSDSLRYLLLFGDCSYDYKTRLPNNTNFVPVYESYESLYPLASFSSDDYFAFLDNLEGAWAEGTTPDEDLMDIGVGRIPVKNSSEASVAVDKLSYYSASQTCLGKWRNEITFVSDDGDGNLHIGDANSLATLIDTTYQLYNVNKIFLDAFVQVASPGGEKAPEVNAKIDQEVNKGTFILNYSGHGGETLWAQENILDLTQIEGWTNYDNMPLMITATCDFGRYDDPRLVSGSETALTRSSGGSIANITSARVVYQFSNIQLNKAIYNFIFKPLSDGQKPRMGDVIRLSKNGSIVGVNNRNYALLGDPSLRLVYPTEDAPITKIKGISVSPVPDTLKALSKVSIQGEVRNKLGAKLTNFNGKLNITVYDKKTNVSTYGTEGGPVFTFSVRNNFLFDGNASVSNGDWSVSFVVPKDISYQYDFGKISVYAEKDGSLDDAGGYYSNVIIGGTDPNAPADNTPPQIHLYMNDESFVFGGITGKDALFLAHLSDENGINTAGSGIGHEIAATLDNSETPIVLNEFYTANLNDYKNGSIKYPFKNLEAGHHTLKLKAWDTYNNSAESYLEFVVASDEHIALSHVLNYPNPFSTHTVFHFDHNRAGDDLDVMIQIYTVSGKLVKTLDTKVYMSGSHFQGLDWDGRDDYGDKIGKGVYVYRVWIRAPRDGSQVHKYERLVLLN